MFSNVFSSHIKIPSVGIRWVTGNLGLSLRIKFLGFEAADMSSEHETETFKGPKAIKKDLTFIIFWNPEVFKPLLWFRGTNLARLEVVDLYWASRSSGRRGSSSWWWHLLSQSVGRVCSAHKVLAIHLYQGQVSKFLWVTLLSY